jgi:hypothetical protein
MSAANECPMSASRKVPPDEMSASRKVRLVQ